MPPSPIITAPAGRALKPFCVEQPIKMRPVMLSKVPALTHEHESAQECFLGVWGGGGGGASWRVHASWRG